MWLNKTSVHLLIPSCAFSIHLSGLCSFHFNFNLSVTCTPFLCCCPSCKSLSQISIFFFFPPPSAYKPENLPPALPRCWKWRECGKGVITMSIHKHHTLRDRMAERSNATGKLPTQPGQVICYTVEQNKHSDTSIYSQSKMDTLVPTWEV